MKDMTHWRLLIQWDVTFWFFIADRWWCVRYIGHRAEIQNWRGSQITSHSGRTWFVGCRYPYVDCLTRVAPCYDSNLHFKQTIPTTMKHFSIISIVMMAALALSSSLVTGFVVDSGRRKQSSALSMTILSYNNKKKDFKPGTPRSKAVEQLGGKPKYSCKK